ncbi:MAG: glycosyltransferase [Deltaproteobacteria bacterium]|nr:glycosyltransferase [Deltaproteobacteria bacterium]MBW2340001.1 glycosyltransferase [Deltaproteobacteria bacterium]
MSKKKKTTRRQKKRHSGSRARYLHAPKKNFPTISLCMMVKNEEELLPQCLESAKDVVDEIIIVDTGSSDRTVEIARSYGAKVYHHPWEHDFSKHRNQSILYASKDWVLIMDADEEFYSEDAPQIKRSLQETHADFLYLQCHDLEKTGNVHGVFNQIRLFRNGLGMHYTETVHNQLQTAGKGAYTKLRFRHYGYDLSPEKMHEKHLRTTSLLKKRINEDPENPDHHYQLAASYSMRREFEKAIEEGEVALALMRRKDLRNSYFSSVYYTVAQGYFVLGDLDKAEEICHEALDFFEFDLNSYHFLAAIYFKKKDLNRCMEMSRKYLEVHQMFEEHPEKMQEIYFNSYVKRHEIYFGMACVHFLEKEFDKAEGYFEKAFRDQGKPLDMAKNITLFYLEQNMEKNALKWLNIAYNIGYRDAELLLKFKDYYVQEGLPGARTRMKALLDVYPSWGAIWTIFGDIQVEEKDISQAVRSYERSISLDPSLRETYTKLSFAYEQLGEIENAIAPCEKLLELFPEDKSTYLRLGGLYLQQQDLEEAARYLQKADEDGLSVAEATKKRFLAVSLSWLSGDVDSLTSNLEEIMKSVGMNTNISIDSSDGLGRVLYDVSERFCSTRQWSLAEMAFRIATQIAPEILDATRFTELLSSAQH